MYKYIYSNVFINVSFINLFVRITKRSYRNQDACDITELDNGAATVPHL